MDSKFFGTGICPQFNVFYKTQLEKVKYFFEDFVKPSNIYIKFSHFALGITECQILKLGFAVIIAISSLL